MDVTHHNEFLLVADIFEQHFAYSMSVNEKSQPIDKATVTKIQHAALSALRNLTVPVANKKLAAAQGRAAPVLINALPSVEDHHVAYKLLAAIRMLVDGQGKKWQLCFSSIL